MGTSLHNKIYLGRQSALASRKVQAALALGLTIGVTVAWYALQSFK
ncbi:MAG TPA: hypothetical protein VFF16_04110 [Telluria sp.]|nr:hypothetical protein [Telluria sp.]